ncbi:NAD(P)H-binding protein [uncultured Tateyamaria sp.]|uniref:NAD(P)H-binding protein n=1 Tax=uncultured Tateyamaria sp. TaxID=455651 RepID=UPI002616F31D|nr:NAD(P)H-binding protein [uncultured Tateyamaria sp.]
MESVIVLGAKGRFGRAAVAGFRAAGWRVTELARAWPEEGTGRVTADVTDTAAVVQACMGHDVIVNAVHPPYPQWSEMVPKITSTVIAAAKASGATVLIPGNVYNYGTSMPERLSETSPWVGDTKKGAIRIRMESAFRDSGVRTIVLRGGDFIDGADTGNWFETYITAKADKGKLTYPGKRDRVHAWSYLPDMGRAAAALAGKRAEFSSFEEFGFGGYALTGDALIALTEGALGRPMKVSGFPWFAIKTMALWSPLMREVLEMRYLWNAPHHLDGSKLRAALPDFVETPVEAAFAQALSKHTQANVLQSALA